MLRGDPARLLYPYAIYACCEPQRHARAAATDSLPDDSADESDPADNVDDADTENATTSTAAGSVESVAASSGTSDCCEVCLLLPCEGVALVPCGHSRFCGSCADTVASLDRTCPLCRTHPFHGCSGSGMREDGVPHFFRQGDTSPTPPHFFGLKFVQKLAHCCNWLFAETQCKIILVQQN